MSEPILELRGYGVHLHGRAILQGLDLTLPARGISALMGPGGAGKSTLVRAISGVFAGQPAYDSFGQLLYAGEPGTPERCPALVDQRLSISMSSVADMLAANLPQRGSLTRGQQLELFAQTAAELGVPELGGLLEVSCLDLSLAQRRQLAILRATLTAPRLLCVDEPTAELDDEDSARIITMLSRYAERAAILFVTHHLSQARAVACQITLLAGGRLIETASPEVFFERPENPTTATYVRTGNCCVPALDEEEQVDGPTEPAADPLGAWTSHVAVAPPSRVPSLDRIPARREDAPSEAVGPRGFRWLVPGRLAGTPQPGLLRDMALDVEALKRASVTVLISLIEQPLCLDDLHCIGVPIPDMQAPLIEQAAALCARVSILLAQGECVAFHCKAGIGRTGTMLAAQLIWGGKTSEEAIAQVREVNPQWIQSVEQENFLRHFGVWCAPQDV